MHLFLFSFGQAALRFKFAILAAAMAVACTAVGVQAADYTWDIASGNGVIDDGSGTWDTTIDNWTFDGGATDTAWPDNTNDIAVFNGRVGGAVAVSGSFSAAGILFSGVGANSYTLSGADNPTLTLGTGGVSVESMAGAQMLDSALRLALIASQSWSNDSASLLTINSDVSAASTATLTVRGAGDTSLGGNLADGAGTLRLIKADEGRLTLSGAGSSYSGPTTVNAGTLTVSAGTVATLNVSGGTADLNSPGSALAVNVGGGMLNLNGNVTHALRVTGGTVTVGAGATIGTGDFRLGTGMVNATNALTITNQVILNANVKVVLGGGGTSFTLGGEDILHPSVDRHRTITVSGGELSMGGAIYPTSGLKGRWTFDDGTADDSSGNGHHGSAVNDPTYDALDCVGGGQCLVQNGTSYVKVDTGGNQSVFDGGGAMTISAWVKGWPYRNSSFVSKYGDGGQGWRIGRLNNWGNMSWITRGIEEENLYQNTSFHWDWELITTTYDGETKRFYYNGVLDGEVAATGTIASTSAWLILGGRSDAAHNIGVGNFRPYSGKLDDIYFYDRALSADEVTEIYNYVTDLDWSTTDLAVSESSQVLLPAGITRLGHLTLSSSGTQLTLGETGAVVASFDDIITDDDASVAGSARMAIRSGNVSVPGGKTLTVSPAIVDDSTSAPLNKLDGGTLVLAGTNDYTGDTWVLGGTLSLSQPSLADAADVHLAAGSGLDLTFTGTDTIWSLYVDGERQLYGRWAAVGSTSPHDYESARLHGSGTLTVRQGPYVVIIVR